LMILANRICLDHSYVRLTLHLHMSVVS